MDPRVRGSSITATCWKCMQQRNRQPKDDVRKCDSLQRWTKQETLLLDRNSGPPASCHGGVNYKESEFLRVISLNVHSCLVKERSMSVLVATCQSLRWPQSGCVCGFNVFTVVVCIKLFSNILSPSKYYMHQYITGAAVCLICNHFGDQNNQD